MNNIRSKITDKYSYEIKDHRENQKYIEKFDRYKKIIFASIPCLFIMLIGLIGYIIYEHYQREKLDNKIIVLENKQDSVKLKQMLNNLNEAEISLAQIQKYLKDRKVNTISSSNINSNSKIDVGGEYYSVNELNADLIKSKRDRVKDLQEKLKLIPIGLPHTGKLTSDFGVRGNPMQRKGSEFHPGLDIAGTMGAPIQVTADGKVVYAGARGGYGNCVIVKHGFGYQTLYGHMSKIKVKAGQEIKAGDIIGLLGSTGRSTGPHVHYEVIHKNTKTNPKEYITIS